MIFISNQYAHHVSLTMYKNQKCKGLHSKKVLLLTGDIDKRFGSLPSSL